MGAYMIEGNRTADAALAVLAINADATLPRRAKLFEFGFGSEATPADNAFLWVLDRGTTALGTSTGVTPSPADPADVASVTDAGENHTVNPTIGARLYSQALNQRASFRWVATPGRELVVAAAANNSLVARTTTMTAVAIKASMGFDE